MKNSKMIKIYCLAVIIAALGVVTVIHKVETDKQTAENLMKNIPIISLDFENLR